MTADNWNIKLQPPSLSPWNPVKGRQIAVLMSGGVDSSVAAHLLRADGWEVLGITMTIPATCAGHSSGCCGADAALVCGQLDLPHYYVDVTDAFNELIIKNFRAAYATGLTPNPCVDCNSLLKFSLVWDFLREELGIEYLATGHYAQVIEIADGFRLCRARDKAKDQSYFLYGISPEKLPKFVLPLGQLEKEQVRTIAKELGLSVADKADSMELCFAGEGDYRIALEDEQLDRAGDITDMAGNKIGTHKGIANYTLGQRRGIGFAGGKPLYVGKIDAATNTIALGTREQISFDTIKAEQVNVLAPEKFVVGGRFTGRIRSYSEPAACTIMDISQNQSGDIMVVRFEQAQFAPCPGQRLVLYDEDENVVAGGTITSGEN